MAVDFLIEIERNKSIGNRTYNNYVEFYRGLWNWLIEKNYCKNNIFTNFKKKEEEEKIRQIIDPKSHLKIIDYCRNNMPNMEIVIDLVRSSFIRPAEICRIKISNIDLFNKVISIPQGNSKTKKFRFAYLPDWLVYKIINNMSLENYPLDFYLLTRNLKPGTKKIGTRELDKYWAKIRTDLNLGMELQLYSYRDTGITALEDAGIQRRVIIKLTGHQSEEMAGKYIRQPSRELIDNIVTKIKE
jgi:integrase